MPQNAYLGILSVKLALLIKDMMKQKTAMGPLSHGGKNNLGHLIEIFMKNHTQLRNVDKNKSMFGYLTEIF